MNESSLIKLPNAMLRDSTSTRTVPATTTSRAASPAHDVPMTTPAVLTSESSTPYTRLRTRKGSTSFSAYITV